MTTIRAISRTQKITVNPATQAIGVTNAGPVGPAGIGVDGGMSGEIRMWAASAVPVSWLECDGTAVSRTTYASLFSIIGTTWGVGNGTTTFNVPDLRGRAPVGAGAGAGLTARTLGVSAGAETVTLTGAQSGVKPHVHNVDPPSTSVSITDPGHNHTQNAHTHTQNAHNHGRITDVIVAHPFSASGGAIASVPNSFSATDKLGPLVPDATATNQNATPTNNASSTGVTGTVNIAAFDSASAAAANATDPVSLVQPIAAVKFIIKA